MRLAVSGTISRSMIGSFSGAALQLSAIGLAASVGKT
jgi:hypothetical protein